MNQDLPYAPHDESPWEWEYEFPPEPPTYKERELYIFIDESGNLDFKTNKSNGKSSGTNHFVLAAYITPSPRQCGAQIEELKYEFFNRNLMSQLPFHAVKNSDGTRKRFLQAICKCGNCWAHVIYCNKHYAHPSKHEQSAFYTLVAGALTKYLTQANARNYEKLNFIFDTAVPKKIQETFIKELKPQLKTAGISYNIVFWPVKHEPCGQVADYYAWSIYRTLEHGDNTYSVHLPHNRSLFNIFRNGHTIYW